jgi:predicted Zn-dependent protease
MFVESSKTATEEQLREQLIKTCRKEKKEYGLYFKEVSNGFTTTSKLAPNTFSITPVLVYKVYTDGSPDELIKGVSLIGTPLTLFSEINETGNKVDVFNGYCGAESGLIPVSTIAPSLFLNKIEIQKNFELKNSKKHLKRPDLITKN